MIVEVGHTDSDQTSVLHIPDLELVVAGDVIYNGVHMYLGQSVVVGGFGPWRDAIDKIEALKPWHIVAGHQNKQLDDDAQRTIAETRQYLDDADEHLRTENAAGDFFSAKIERYPNHLGRTVLWAGASALCHVREHPERTSGGSSLPDGFERGRRRDVVRHPGLAARASASPGDAGRLIPRGGSGRSPRSEELLGRRVPVFISDSNVGPNREIELFVLAPRAVALVD